MKVLLKLMNFSEYTREYKKSIIGSRLSKSHKYLILIFANSDIATVENSRIPISLYWEIPGNHYPRNSNVREIKYAKKWKNKPKNSFNIFELLQLKLYRPAPWSLSCTISECHHFHLHEHSLISPSMLWRDKSLWS